MYSSSPNLIKHYVPISFSRQSLDYESSPKKAIQPLDDNPLMNKKLQNLNDRPKDFVLIFKNKSCREYSPKKKIRYSSLLKDLRNGKKSLSPDYDQNVDNNRTDNQF